jgi:enoyl-CoA hydratase/carnithine racemase
VRSAGKNFSAGADLKERKEMTIDEVPRFVQKLVGAVNAVAALPVPTIAAINGVAAGGGCELALGCDLRILSDDARIGLRETALAIIPGAGGTQRLPRLIGPSRAKRWIFTAALYSADEALADGVADRVVPTDKLDETAREMAASIARNGPVGIRQAKRAIDGGLEVPLDRALEIEWECWNGTLDTEDRVEALKAFAEKRAPRFRGR